METLCFFPILHQNSMSHLFIAASSYAIHNILFVRQKKYYHIWPSASFHYFANFWSFNVGVLKAFNYYYYRHNLSFDNSICFVYLSSIYINVFCSIRNNSFMRYYGEHLKMWVCKLVSIIIIITQDITFDNSICLVGL